MVYAFIIHTIIPGTCRIIYSASYGQEDLVNDLKSNSPKEGGTKPGSELRTENKLKLLKVAQLVQSEYGFRRAVSGKTVEADLQKLNNDDTLPELELGFLRLAAGEIFNQEKIAVWLGAANCGFTLICEKNENRMLAENVLKLIIRFLQEYVRILNQPTEAMTKVDRAALVLDRFLPGGQLLYMNNRVVRQFEKELEIVMKN